MHHVPPNIAYSISKINGGISYRARIPNSRRALRHAQSDTCLFGYVLLLSPYKALIREERHRLFYIRNLAFRSPFTPYRWSHLDEPCYDRHGDGQDNFQFSRSGVLALTPPARSRRGHVRVHIPEDDGPWRGSFKSPSRCRHADDHHPATGGNGEVEACLQTVLSG